QQERGRAQQGGFAGAVRPEERHHAAGFHPELIYVQDCSAPRHHSDALEAQHRMLLAHMRRIRCSTSARLLAINSTIMRRMNPSASAVPKLPFPISRTAAVVSTRVSPDRLPPTTVDAPTSDTTAPNPAITATRSGSRASRATSVRY